MSSKSSSQRAPGCAKGDSNIVLSTGRAGRDGTWTDHRGLKGQKMQPSCPPQASVCPVQPAGSHAMVCSSMGPILLPGSRSVEVIISAGQGGFSTHKQRQPIPTQGRILPTPSAHAPACWGKSCCCSRQIIAPSLASPCTLPCKHTHRAFQHSRCRGSKARPTERLSSCKGETKGVCPCGKQLSSASGALRSRHASEQAFVVELDVAWTNQWKSNGSWDSLGSTLQSAQQEEGCPSSPQ